MSIHSTIEKIKYEFLHLFRKLRDIDSRLVKQEIKLQNIELIKKTENTKLILDTKAIRALIASLREEIEALHVLLMELELFKINNNIKRL